MKQQTIEDMIDVGATPSEAKRAEAIWEMLRPGLRIKSNGRVDTAGGDKTKLGLYRSILRVIEEVER